MARLVYDLMENVILIQRIYICSNGGRRHWMRATTPDIHTALPSHIQESFSAVVFQRCCFTKTVVNYIDTEVERGVNFLKISEGLASLHFREYLRRRRLYAKACSDVATRMSESTDFHCNVFYSFPSNDQLINIFLFNFERNKVIYNKDMASLSVSALSCDQTFKIGRKVGLVRETDNTFVTQFQQLFISLNEIGCLEVNLIHEL